MAETPGDTAGAGSAGAGSAGLGFDPAPGDPAAVLALTRTLRTSATSLGEASRVIDALVSNSSAWQGEAATAFRSSLSGELPRYLKAAHTSLTEAAGRLASWHDTLVSHRALAARYAAAAAAAKTPPELADARRLAHELASEHAASARRVSATLNATAARLAPEEPGWFESAWRKVVDDPGDALSNASAMLGFVGAAVALAFPPAGLAIVLVAGGLSLAALATHLSDPKFRKPLKDGFTKGEFDADFWKSGVTALGDTMGVVPGLASVATGAKAGTTALRAAMAAAPEATAVSALAPGAGAFGRTTWSTGLALQEVENPLIKWGLRTTNTHVRDSVNMVAPTMGATTATLDCFSDDEVVEHASTTADGVRGAFDDVPSAIAKTVQAGTVMGR
ncbi:putative T7SS-secreted protein [Streptomyces sp. NPDC088097]|uniref:putative T7SS-secreted protein n=1 Tax=Streptomyces sp. NPDC088097 TaxID=3365823 RepID=UPI00381E96A9